MKELKTTTDIVKAVLSRSEKARNSDNYLYYVICKTILASEGKDISSISFREGLLFRNDLGLPAFETVRRARQKIQQHCPELAGSEEVESRRLVRESEFREYARRFGV